MSVTYGVIISIFQYIPGNVGIILSVPHGGCLDHPEIPDRTDVALNNLVNNNNNANCDLPDTLVSEPRKIRTRGDGWTIDLGQEIYENKFDKKSCVIVRQTCKLVTLHYFSLFRLT